MSEEQRLEAVRKEALAKDWSLWPETFLLDVETHYAILLELERLAVMKRKARRIVK